MGTFGVPPPAAGICLELRDYELPVSNSRFRASTWVLNFLITTKRWIQCLCLSGYRVPQMDLAQSIVIFFGPTVVG